MWTRLYLAVIVLSSFLLPGETVLELFPEDKTIPQDDQSPAIFTAIVCRITADFMLNQTVIESEWTTPSGVIINSTTQGRYNKNNGPGLSPFESVLVIRNISSSDAGTYKCDVRDIRNPGSPGQWISGTLILQILVGLTTNDSEVSTFDNETQIELQCEMYNYLHPDDSLQWFREGQLIVSETERYTITYQNGNSQLRGQFGGDALISSRVTTLTISSPQQADSGAFSCEITDTDQSETIQLTVQEGIPSTVQPTSSSPSGSTTSPTPTAKANNDSNSLPLPTIIGAVAAVLGIIVIVLIIIIIIVAIRRRSHSVVITENGDHYDALNGGAPFSKGSKSVSPPPALPPRSTNAIDSEESYDVPDHKNFKDKRSPQPKLPPPDYESLDAAGKYDPYYDSPEDIKTKRLHPPTPRDAPIGGAGNAMYDEVDTLQSGGARSKANSIDMRSVPSPAVVLSGSLHRQIEQRNPDFAYPNYQDGFDFSMEPDYDQIYSEPLDPTMMRPIGTENVVVHDHEEAVPYSAIYEDPSNPFPDTDVPAPVKVTQKNIIEIRKLGTGQFGQVILAKTMGINIKDIGMLAEKDLEFNKSILVAIKKLKPDAESSLQEAFDKEVKFMSRLKHDNVVRLLGVCTGPESFIMMEYMENGDLNQFLQKQALMSDSISGLQENQITPIILLYMGVQIASGMHYLASRRFVHRDLATRNCLVGKDFIVKISDFGMSRSLYESAYYRVQGTLVLPIRWMACETFYGKFSVKSDAWAFGVTLWEIYTLGKVDPYENLTDEEVIADAIRGPDRQLLPRPNTCLQEVYEIMQRCWVNEPSMRADFGEIYSRLFMIYTQQAL